MKERGEVGICSALIAGGRVSRERTEIGGHLGHLACHVIPLKCVLKYPNIPSKIAPKLPYVLVSDQSIILTRKNDMWK